MLLGAILQWLIWPYREQLRMNSSCRNISSRPRILHIGDDEAVAGYDHVKKTSNFGI